MNLRSQLGSVRRHVLASFYSRPVRLGPLGPVVTFSFDDFPRSAYTAGGEILKSYGVRGTYYAAVGLMNTFNELGEQFRPSDLEALVADGHELASHTFSHISCRSIPNSAFLAEVEHGRKAIRELTGEQDSGNFAFPFGDFTVGARRSLSANLASCRGILGGVNGPDVDLSLLRANSIYGDIDDSGVVERLLDRTVRQKGWLVFYSHDVQRNPSRFGCTPQLLESVVSQAIKVGARIMTVAEVLGELGATACSMLNAESIPAQASDIH
jgi:peptidoglycan/xylan/chitin deacetylase (PgdA/CDA1 family)